MAYKKKITVLLTIIAALVLVYALTVVFEPERAGARSAAFTWLDPKKSGQIEKISVSGAGNTTELVRKNSRWFVSYNGREYPARQFRVDDFIGAFTKRAAYPVRSSSASSHQRLGLTEDAASRVTMTASGAAVLLDLLVGQGDATGQNIYLRKQGQNETRSGEDIFTAYISSPRTAWYNLRLFPETEDGGIDAAGVQRLTVYAEGSTEPQVFTRNDGEWTFSGISVANPDMAAVDAYIRDLLNTEGDNFDDTVSASDALFEANRIVLELGDGSIKTVRLGPPDESRRRFAAVSGSEHVYSLPSWSAQRLFKTAGDFEKQQ